MKIRINMLSAAESVPGQGVASAFREQYNLIKDIDGLNVTINSKSSNFDVYHIHSPNLGYRLRMNKKHLNVVHVHFVPARNHESIKLPWLFEKIFDSYVNHLYKKADELVVVNPSFIKDLENLKIPNDKITYIPNFVDSSSFYELTSDEIDEIKRKYNIPLDKFVVLGCGQIQTRKGIDDFIETAKQNPNMQFIWVGGFPFGKIMHGYKKYKKLFQNLPQNVTHIEILDRKYMNEIFNMCDVFFMPSYLELFPMTILEIVNVHKPFLVRDLELYKPILFSKYCKGNDPDSFSIELNKLMNDTTYYNEKVDDSKFIADFYNKDVLKKTWKEYYQRVYLKWKMKKEKK